VHTLLDRRVNFDVGLACLCFILAVVNRDMCAFGRESYGNRLTDAGGASGDKYALTD